MTAQIAVMNKEAVALASDSAVTMREKRGQKMFSSANKLFTLSKYEPVGIMAYGTADFMGVPWESIVKMYRAELARQRFETLGGYAEHFIAFLNDGNPLFPESEQRNNVYRTAARFYNRVKEALFKRVKATVERRAQVKEAEIFDVASRVIEGYHSWLQQCADLPTLPAGHLGNVLNKYGDVIDRARENIFQELPLSDLSQRQLRETAAALFCKDAHIRRVSRMSGVVIAGFGENDFFPMIRSFWVDSVADNKLKYKVKRVPEISFDNPAAVIPFAQAEMVHTFMEGIDPSLYRFTHDFLSAAFDKHSEGTLQLLDKYDDKEKDKLREKLKHESGKLLEDYRRQMQSRKGASFIGPIVDVVAMLPKDELAAMAESLVSLTSFKRRVTMEEETVAGPIDVAVISKGDGLIWIKRKHYFKSELNAQFFANYYRR